MNALMTALVGAITQEGVRRLSKTKLAAHVGGAGALAAILPGVLNKEPAAIGELVLWLIGWAGTLWGRGNAG